MATARSQRFAAERSLGQLARKLGEYDVFVRDAPSVSILHRILGRGEPPINTILARDKEFGWTSNFDGFHEKGRAGDLPIYYIRKMKRGVGYIARTAVTKSDHLIDTWKVLVPEAFNGGDGHSTSDRGQAIDRAVAIRLYPVVPVSFTLARATLRGVFSRTTRRGSFNSLSLCERSLSTRRTPLTLGCRYRHGIVLGRTRICTRSMASRGRSKKFIESQVRADEPRQR